jgi:hypothetical protein
VTHHSYMTNYTIPSSSSQRPHRQKLQMHCRLRHIVQLFVNAVSTDSLNICLLQNDTGLLMRPCLYL